MMKDYSVSKAVESQIRRINIFYPGKDLDQCDLDLFRDVLLLEYHLIEDLLPSKEQSLRHFRGFLGSSEIDIMKFAQTLKHADTYVKNSLQDVSLGAVRDLQSFKRSVKDAGLYWGLMRPFEEVFVSFFERFEPDTFRILNTWINFPGRANFRSLDLSEDLAVDYVNFEKSMETWEYDDQLISELNCVMREWLKDFTFEHYVPKHGPGSVAGHIGRLPVLLKHQIHSIDRRLRYFYTHDIDRPIEDDFPFDLVDDLTRTSDIVFVPKSMTKNRTISKEPVSLQYTQQGVFRALDVYFREHPYLSTRIDLHKRELSQESARQGSIAGELDTLDLSNASDSVSLSLIKGMFAHTPLLRALICTRSDRTRLPNGSTVVLNKFAPMGSALCFPIENLVFACICEVASRRSGRRSYYRVYGDDIVLAHDLSERVIHLLDQLNFQLNTEKSFFYQGIVNFREACGGEYINGVDVSPLRVSRWFKSYDDEKRRAISSADTVQSYCSFANNAYDKGMLHVRRGILQLLRTRFPFFDGLLFARDGAHLVSFDDGLTNWKLKKRFRLTGSGRRGCYQRLEIRCVDVCQKGDERVLNALASKYSLSTQFEDDIRYFEYWRSRLDSSYYDGILVGGLIFPKEDHWSRRRSPGWVIGSILYPPEPVKVRPTRTVMLWKWIYQRN